MSNSQGVSAGAIRFKRGAEVPANLKDGELFIRENANGTRDLIIGGGSENNKSLLRVAPNTYLGYLTFGTAAFSFSCGDYLYESFEGTNIDLITKNITMPVDFPFSFVTQTIVCHDTNMGLPLLGKTYNRIIHMTNSFGNVGEDPAVFFDITYSGPILVYIP